MIPMNYGVLFFGQFLSDFFPVANRWQIIATKILLSF